jgi:hypothetical protein
MTVWTHPHAANQHHHILSTFLPSTDRFLWSDALSKRAKQMARRQAINMTYQKAINEYLQEQAKPEGKKCGLCPIAAKHGV